MALDVVDHHVRRVGNAQDDARKAGGTDGLHHVLEDGNGLVQSVHAGLPLGHIRQRADGDDEQLRVFGVGVGPGPDLGPAGEVVGGVEEVQRSMSM